MKKKINPITLLFGAFFGGIIAGSIAMNAYLASDVYLLESLVLTSFDIREVMQMARDKLFIYITLKRAKQLIVLLILLKLFPPYFVTLISCVTLGVGLGGILSLETIHLGMKGIFLTLINLFPHYFFYLAGAGILCFLSIHRKKKEEVLQRKGLSNFLLIFFTIGCILLIGVLLESYLTPMLIRNFYSVTQ